MKAIIGLVTALGLGGAALIGSHRTAPKHVGPRVPVLVELFTSEGCSSCPPADRLLAELQKDQPVDGALIIPLSEHVDYWDNDSWRDPFSSAKFSLRQGQYVSSLHASGSYTPQMVVDGRSEFVGSDSGAASDAIAKAVERQKANVSLSFANGTASVGVSGLPQGSNELYLVVAENNLASNVRGGENEGNKLAHTAVVRSIRKVDAVGTAPFSKMVPLALSPKWKRNDLTIVAFVQDSKTRRILGVAAATAGKP